MPGHLAEKIKLWSVLNRILKNNGFIDGDRIISDLATLKEQVNRLLSEILGVEHTVDDLHNYDDASIKESLLHLESNLSDRIELIRADTEANTNKLSGIETTSTKINIKKTAEIKFDNTINNAQDGSKISILPGYLVLINKDNSVNNRNQILIGNGTSDGTVSIESTKSVNIATAHLYRWIRVGDTAMEINDISDVNGLKIKYDDTKIMFTNFDDTKHVYLNWA
jgi:hypothetical protein